MYRSNQLTLKEIAIIQLIVNGMTNKEISDYLEIPFATVKLKISKIFKKTGFQDRVSLSIWAVLAGVAKANVLNVK